MADQTPISLYNGETVAQASTSIAPWGGGAVSDTDQANYADGKRSLIVTTDGPYQGALFTFSPSAVVGDVASDKTHYITIALTQTPAGPPQPMSMPKPKSKNALPDEIGSAPHGFLHLAQYAGPGQQPVAPPPGGPGPALDQNGNPIVAAPPPPPPINFIRVVVTADSGDSAECIRAVPLPFSNTTWTTVSFPLSELALPAADRSNLKIKSVMIAGDTPAKFYLGYARIVADSQPLAASIQGDSDVAPGSPANWSFLINSGVSNIRWDWQIDDGSPVEHGQTVTHAFAKAGVYHVTLTVYDVDNIKAPCTAKIKVVVQDQ